MGALEERRNREPQTVRVMSCADFDQDASLDDRTEAMIENRNEVAIHNVEFLLGLHHISQAQMCSQDLEGSPKPAQMAAYKKVGRDIPFRTVARIGMRYGYTPEQMYGQLLDRGEAPVCARETYPPRPAEEYRKYIGTYHLAYLGTDARLGCNKRTTARCLRSGMLSIYAEEGSDGVSGMKVVAYTNCTDQETRRLETMTRNAEALRSSKAVRDCYDTVASEGVEQGDLPKIKYLYSGDLVLTERTAMITLHQVRGSNAIHLELHNRAANSSEGNPYKGGLATVMSTSRGQEHMPCVQAAILSKRSFESRAREELAELLYLEPPRVEVEEETDSIITYMKALFPGDKSENPLSRLSDEDKAFMLRSYIEKKLTGVIKHNVLGYYKVSTEMDARIYKAVCR